MPRASLPRRLMTRLSLTLGLMPRIVSAPHRVSLRGDITFYFPLHIQFRSTVMSLSVPVSVSLRAPLLASVL
jgi:hypothetical protein